MVNDGHFTPRGLQRAEPGHSTKKNKVCDPVRTGTIGPLISQQAEPYIFKARDPAHGPYTRQA